MTASAPSGARYGVTSMVAPLRRVLVRRPATSGDWDGAGWRTPDPATLERQHAAFVELLDGLGVEVEVAPALEGQVDACYMHDPLILSGAGGIPLNMAKPARQREPGHAAEELGAARHPGARHARAATPTPTAATASGSTTRPRRSASATARTARARRRCRRCSSPRASTSRPTTCRTTRARRTSCTCSRSCRPRPRSLFVVYEPLAPVRLLTDISERGIDWIAIDRESYHEHGLQRARGAAGRRRDGRRAPRRCARALEQRGVEVHVYEGSDISLKGDGGPTCLTAPLLRA